MRKLLSALLLSVGLAASPALGQTVVNLANTYPQGATPQFGASTATTAGITTLAMNGAVGNQFAYVSGFSVSPGSATAAITLTVTLTVGGVSTMTWTVGAPVTAAGVTGSPLTVNFSPPLKSAVGNTISISVGALGAGGVGQTAQVWGYTSSQ